MYIKCVLNDTDHFKVGNILLHFLIKLTLNVFFDDFNAFFSF